MSDIVVLLIFGLVSAATFLFMAGLEKLKEQK
jgi:hypothetical protein